MTACTAAGCGESGTSGKVFMGPSKLTLHRSFLSQQMSRFGSCLSMLFCLNFKHFDFFFGFDLLQFIDTEYNFLVFLFAFCSAGN
jgi:hypothetical protein